MFSVVVAQVEQNFCGMRSKSEKSVDSKINGQAEIN